VHGRTSLADGEERYQAECVRLGLELVFRQSDHEGRSLDWIHTFDIVDQTQEHGTSPACTSADEPAARRAVRSSVPALPCVMNMGRFQMVLAVVASVLLTVTGVWLGLTKEGTDTAVLGWILAFVGAVGLPVNLYLRTRVR